MFKQLMSCAQFAMAIFSGCLLKISSVIPLNTASRSVGGACFSLSITPGWTSGDSLVGGAGWIAVALVIFSFWRPELCLLGAWLFGGLSGGLPAAIQAGDYAGIPVFFRTPEFLNALPYLTTIVVLVLIATGWAKRRVGAPAALGVPYVREER